MCSCMGVPEEDIDIRRIDSKEDLKSTWTTWSNYEVVEGLFFYSHGYSGGPEVYGGSGDVLRNDNLEKLNWGYQERQLTFNGKQYSAPMAPTARFFGCNTGTGDFAQNFANKQGVITMGQTNYSRFSYTRDTYSKIKTHDTSLGVYMGVYKRNIFGVKTTLIDMKIFVPN